MASAVVGNSNHPSEETVVSAALLAVRGVACVASGYTGASVVGSSENIGIQPGFGAGKWRSLIIYVSVMMFTASLGAIGLNTTLRSAKETSDEDNSEVSEVRHSASEAEHAQVVTEKH